VRARRIGSAEPSRLWPCPALWQLQRMVVPNLPLPLPLRVPLCSRRPFGLCARDGHALRSRGTRSSGRRFCQWPWVKRGDACGPSRGAIPLPCRRDRGGALARADLVRSASGACRELFPFVLGTLVSQTPAELVSLVILGTVMFLRRPLPGPPGAYRSLISPLVTVLCRLAAPALLRRAPLVCPSVGMVAHARAAPCARFFRGLEFSHPLLGWVAPASSRVWASQ